MRHPLSPKVRTNFADKRRRSVVTVRSRTQATEFVYDDVCFVDRVQANPAVEVKAILVTGRGCLWDSVTLRSSHFLDNCLTDGGKFVSITRRPAALYPQEDSWYSFLLETEPTPGP
jgi:hypothetical protein